MSKTNVWGLDLKPKVKLPEVLPLVQSLCRIASWALVPQGTSWMRHTRWFGVWVFTRCVQRCTHASGLTGVESFHRRLLFFLSRGSPPQRFHLLIFLGLELFLAFKKYCGKIQKHKIYHITIFKCIFQQCYKHLHCCATTLQIFFILQNWNSPFPLPQPLANHCSSCVYERDCFRYHS